MRDKDELIREPSFQFNEDTTIAYVEQIKALAKVVLSREPKITTLKLMRTDETLRKLMGFKK